jgi:hypothetical protein
MLRKSTQGTNYCKIKGKDRFSETFQTEGGAKLGTFGDFSTYSTIKINKMENGKINGIIKILTRFFLSNVDRSQQGVSSPIIKNSQKAAKKATRMLCLYVFRITIFS